MVTIREGCQVVTDRRDSAESSGPDTTFSGRARSVAGVVSALGHDPGA